MKSISLATFKKKKKSPNVLLCIHKFSDTSLDVYAVVMEMLFS